ncbi:MAG: hypothetical protein FJY88_04440 [Candidatus Eisenbacteria bacterium]|nr:hypothetical protein [Candidatus Eisenbacteria bacterium]
MTGPERSGGDAVVLLAPLCVDEIVTRGGQGSVGVRRVAPGGVGLYAAWALARLGARVILHTPLARADVGLLSALPPSVEAIVHPTRETTRFRIEIDPGAPDERLLLAIAASDPLDPDRLSGLGESAYILLGPLLPRDLSREISDRLAAGGRPIDLGIQGLVRDVAPDGTVRMKPAMSRPSLQPLRIVAGDEAEVALFSGVSDLEAALLALVRDSAREAVATAGSKGARIRVRGESASHLIAPTPARTGGGRPVGLGDTFLAAYGWHRERGQAPQRAGALAASAAAALLEEGLPAA